MSFGPYYMVCNDDGLPGLTRRKMVTAQVEKSAGRKKHNRMVGDGGEHDLPHAKTETQTVQHIA